MLIVRGDTKRYINVYGNLCVVIKKNVQSEIHLLEKGDVDSHFVSLAKQNTYKRNMHLCRPEIPRSEVRIPLKSKYYLFLNISNNLEKFLLSIQMYCSLIFTNVCLFFCPLADFIVSNKNVTWGGGGRTKLKQRPKQIILRNRLFLK